jgi:hypothetical protein
MKDTQLASLAYAIAGIGCPSRQPMVCALAARRGRSAGKPRADSHARRPFRRTALVTMFASREDCKPPPVPGSERGVIIVWCSRRYARAALGPCGCPRRSREGGSKRVSALRGQPSLPRRLSDRRSDPPERANRQPPEAAVESLSRYKTFS